MGKEAIGKRHRRCNKRRSRLPIIAFVKMTYLTKYIVPPCKFLTSPGYNSDHSNLPEQGKTSGSLRHYLYHMILFKITKALIDVTSTYREDK